MRDLFLIFGGFGVFLLLVVGLTSENPLNDPSNRYVASTRDSIYITDTMYVRSSEQDGTTTILLKRIEGLQLQLKNKPICDEY